jgi:exodeoxyribonuclease V alpha subunit
MTATKLFETLRTKPHFQPMDLHLARLLSKLAGEDDPLLFLSVCLVSRGLSQGDVCLELDRHAGNVFSCEELHIDLPPARSWSESLLNSKVVGRPGAFTPLVLDEQGRLYLHRYFSYEQELARDLLLRATPPRSSPPEETVTRGLDLIFPVGAGDIDWPRIAARAAARSRLCIISGGPGTGKTTTVAKVLALLLLTEPERQRFGLAAPTGKAAARLQEAIARVKPSLPLEAHLREKIPAHASTIHRLLGAMPNSISFRHNRANPLPLDTLVVDEASMVDLALMHRLLEALPSTSRLILLGDRDQLSSVEGGAVLGDISSHPLAEKFSKQFACAAESQEHPPLPSSADVGPLSDSIVLLQKSYRFSGGGIEPLRLAIRDQDAESALRVLRDESLPDVRILHCHSQAELFLLMKEPVLSGYAPLFGAGSPEEAFAFLDGLRVLSPLREGPYGTGRLNQLVERTLQNLGVIPAGAGGMYPGRPLIIERNDYAQQLFNGDLGILWPSGATDLAFFPSAQGMKGFPPVLLPAHETAYAMTVHKSQGSEFDHVLLVLPDIDLPILTRELLYTGVTRARKSVCIIGSEAVLRACIRRRTIRSSGLGDLLWKERGLQGEDIE